MRGPGGTEVSVGWHQAGRAVPSPGTTLLPRPCCVPLAKPVKCQPGHWVRVTRFLLELPEHCRNSSSSGVCRTPLSYFQPTGTFPL